VSFLQIPEEDDCMSLEERKVVQYDTSFPMIGELLYEFKAYCELRNWTAHSIGDLIEADSEYHKFFWIRGLYVSTFKRIVANPSCALREGLSCRTVRPKYLAWVLPVTPPTLLWLYLVKEAPKLSKTVALYDLSRAYEGDDASLKLNETPSVVFEGFEQFLQEKYRIHLMSLISRRPSPAHAHSI
jgi:hypothetical protein